MCARRRSSFLCLAKERNQRKATPLAVSLRFAAGNLRCSIMGRRRRTHYALRAPFKQPRRVRARSMGMLRCPCPPHALRSSARPEGSWETTRAIASLGLQGAGASRRMCGAERSDGPLGFHHPSARAEEHRAWGGRMQRSMHALCALTHCGCLNGAPKARSEFRNAAPRPSTAGCPQRSGGTREVGSPFFGSFLWRDKERNCAAGRTSRPTALPAKAEIQ